MFPTEHRHTDGFEILKSSRQIEKCFCSCRNCDDGIRSNCIKVGRDISGEFCTAMHTTNAPSCKNTDSPGCSNRYCRRNSCCAEIPLLRNCYCNISFSNFASGTKNTFVFGFGQTESHNAIKNCGDRRNATTVANSRTTTIKSFAVCRRWQTKMRINR